MAVAGGWWALPRLGLAGRIGDVVTLFGLIPVGVAVYAGLLWALRVEGRDDLEALFVRLRGRFGGAKG